MWYFAYIKQTFDRKNKLLSKTALHEHLVLFVTLSAEVAANGNSYSYVRCLYTVVSLVEQFLERYIKLKASFPP